MTHLIIDDLFAPALIAAANDCWPGARWPGWVSYCGTGRGEKYASDLAAPVPTPLSVLLARMAALDLGAMLGMAGAAPDLSLYGAGLHAMPAGGSLPAHLDADTHPRLGLARAWSACLYVHDEWHGGWGGELALHGERPVITPPLPGRLVAFDAGVRHEVLAVRCPPGRERRSLALFGYWPKPGANERPRALFFARRTG